MSTDTLLASAIKKSDYEEIVELLDSGVSPYFWLQRQQRSTFHVACQHFNRDVFQILFNQALLMEDLDFKWHSRDVNGRFPHHLLAKQEPSEDLLDIFKQIGHNLKLDLSSKDKQGNDVINYALKNGNHQLVEFLQSKKDEYEGGFNAFWEAITLNDLEQVKKTFVPNHLKNNGPTGTCLQHAINLNHADIVEFLMHDCQADPNEICDHNSCPPVLIAAQMLHLKCFQTLLSNEKTKISTLKDGRNIFHVLLYDKYNIQGHQSGNWEIETNVHKMLCILFQSRSCGETGVLVNQQEPISKNTPLHLAAKLKGQEIIKILLANGAEESLFLANDIRVGKGNTGDDWEARHAEIPANLMQTSTLKEFLDTKITYDGKLNCFKSQNCFAQPITKIFPESQMSHFIRR